MLYFAENNILNVDESNFMNADVYENHPCIRNCEENREPLLCQYTFMVILF